MVTAWRNRIVGSGSERPDQLIANPANWRTHPPAQRDALRGSLSEVGWVQQILVNQRTGHVVDGHARVEEALSRGELEVPVLYVELTPEEEALVLATLDPIGAMATRDDARLRELLAEVQVDDAGLAALLKAMAPPKVGLADPDDVPTPDEDVNIQRGDLFALGEHRLMCGDATDAHDVAAVLAGAKPTMTVTDPPYGVDYDPAWRNELLGEANRRLGTVQGDQTADWSRAWELLPSDVAYVWHAAIHGHSVAADLEECGYELRSQIVWVKPQLVPGRGHYHWRHEACWYAVRAGGTGHWVGDHTQNTVWEIDHILHRQYATDVDPWTQHGTQKPVEAMAHAIRNHAGNVYDPFVGSGTTIIAAEQLGRRCYAMDIDPRYVAVSIGRWEQFTGQKAVKL